MCVCLLNVESIIAKCANQKRQTKKKYKFNMNVPVYVDFVYGSAYICSLDAGGCKNTRLFWQTAFTWSIFQ